MNAENPHTAHIKRAMWGLNHEACAGKWANAWTIQNSNTSWPKGLLKNPFKPALIIGIMSTSSEPEHRSMGIDSPFL